MREGWEIKKLGDVCSIGDGNYSSKYPKANEFLDSGIPFITATNLKNGIIVPNGIRYISEKQHLELTKGHVRENDLVVVVRGSSTGNSSIVQKEFENSNLNSQLAYLRPCEGVDSTYLFYVFNSPLVQKVVNQTISGSAQPQLPNNKLLGIEIPIPPLFEQKQIVAILDKAFATIDQAKANIEKNIENAKELFQSKLNEIFSQPARPSGGKGDDWEEKKLIDICSEITDGSHFSPKSSENEIYPYITVRDINNNIVDFDNCKKINQDNYDLLLKNGCKPFIGDLLFSKDGTVGKVSLIDFEKKFVVLSSLAIIRPLKNTIDSRFLKYILKNPAFLKTAIGKKTGVAIRRIILKNLKQITVRFPTDIIKQRKIVEQLDELSNQSQQLETIYQKKYNDLDDLKKSILQKAFAGELISPERTKKDKDGIYSIGKDTIQVSPGRAK